MNKSKKKVITYISLIVVIVSIVIIVISIKKDRKQDNTVIMAIIADNLSSMNQKRSAVLIDLNKNKIIKTLYSSNIGHDLETAVSPDKKTIAYTKWNDSKMDRNLCIKDINSNTEKGLTANINGEINKISWIDNNNIICVFSGHDSAKFGYGEYIYLYNVKAKTKTLIDGTSTSQSDNKYNTVRYIKNQNKILFVKASYTAYMQSYGKVYKNALYTCDKDGKNEKELVSYNDKIIGRVVEIPNSNKLAIEAYYYDDNGNEVSNIYSYDFETNKSDILLQHNPKFAEYWNILPYNSSSLLFTGNNKLYSIDIKTKDLKEIPINNLNGYQFVSLSTY